MRIIADFDMVIVKEARGEGVSGEGGAGRVDCGKSELGRGQRLNKRALEENCSEKRANFWRKRDILSTFSLVASITRSSPIFERQLSVRANATSVGKALCMRNIEME